MFRSFLDMIMGKFGRSLLNQIELNKVVFLSVFFVYATILIYSKIILLYFYPLKMKEIIKQNPTINDEEKLMALWRQKKRTFKWYILVPSKNELWVRLASKSSDTHQLLFYNQQEISQWDRKKIMELKRSEQF